MVIKKDNTHIIDVNSQHAFTEEDKATYLKLVPDGKTITAYPELYGNDLPPQLKYIGVQLVPVNEIEQGTYITQKYRRHARNRKFDKIRRGINNNGFKLKYPAIAIFKAPNGELYIITGFTRLEILKSLHKCTNIIASIYEGDDKNYTKEEVLDAVSRCGIRFNTIHDEADPTSPDDVRYEVSVAIERGWISFSLADIEKRVDEICGNGVFAPTTRNGLVYEIGNKYNPDDEIISWKGVTNTAIFMQKANLVDTKDIKYICLSSQNPNKTFMAVLDYAVNNPKHEIRFVFHNGTLEGFNLPGCWTERTETFRSWFTGQLSSIGNVYFEGTSPIFNRVKIYGVLPSMASMHDLEKLVHFRNDGTTYQKD